MFDYESPIKVAVADFNAQIDKDILRAVQNFDIAVDKEELLKALSYDRRQYEKGYSDAKSEIVYCKDCKYCSIGEIGIENYFCCRPEDKYSITLDDFCSQGIKRDK